MCVPFTAMYAQSADLPEWALAAEEIVPLLIILDCCIPWDSILPVTPYTSRTGVKKGYSDMFP